MPQLDLLNSALLPHVPTGTVTSQPPDSLLELIKLAPRPGLGEGPRCSQTGKRVTLLFTELPKLRGTLSEAALWLLAGELDQSHAVSQSLETSDGSYWHGVMHRREGDFWNAKYWFRRAGHHPVFAQLAKHLETIGDQLKACDLPLVELTQAATMPSAVVDSCQRALAKHPAQIPILQQICWLEWQFLFLHGWDK